MARKRVLFTFLQSSSFVREDISILHDGYDLDAHRFGTDSKPGPVEFVMLLLRQLVWLLRRIPQASAVYGWFADYHMVLPVLLARLFGKPVIVAVGGFDAISLPSLGYGVGLSSWRRPLAQFVLRAADILLPVSPSLVYSRNRFSEWPEETEQGVKALVPGLRTPLLVVPTGYDPRKWPMGSPQRGPIVSTVGMFDSERTLLRKGLDLVFETARRMTDVRFRVIGVPSPEDVIAMHHPPENVELLPPVSREQLVEHYQATSVYLQLSRAEGLPNVLCEAMLCGCIPVGSRAFGIPDGIGDAGFVVDAPVAGEIAEAVRKALRADPAMRSAARRHIEKHFHIERRREALHDVFERTIQARTPRR